MKKTNQLKIKFYEGFHEVPKNILIDVFQIDTKNFDDELDELENYYISTDPDFIFNSNGEAIKFIDFDYKNKKHIIIMNENRYPIEKFIIAIKKYFNKNKEYKKADKWDWNWDLIRKIKNYKNLYLIYYRGGNGYTYGGGIYKI